MAHAGLPAHLLPYVNPINLQPPPVHYNWDTFEKTITLVTGRQLVSAISDNDPLLCRPDLDFDLTHAVFEDYWDESENPWHALGRELHLQASIDDTRHAFHEQLVQNAGSLTPTEEAHFVHSRYSRSLDVISQRVLINKIIARIPRFHERCAEYLAKHPHFFEDNAEKALLYES